VERLLATEPSQTMASISTWADEHRNPATALKPHRPLRFSHSRFQKISPRLDNHHQRHGVKLTVAQQCLVDLCAGIRVLRGQEWLGLRAQIPMPLYDP